jgi:hypothetical protein
MAVNISDTKHFKKGEKLPDGSTAKRGVVINTKTGKRVTGTVLMGASGASASTKKYKAGRSVSAMKAKAEKVRKPSPLPSGGGAGGGDTSAAKKALAKRLQQNKGVKGGTIRAGAAGKGVRKYNAKTGRWDRVAQQGTGAAANQNQGQSGVSSRTPSNYSNLPSRPKPKPTGGGKKSMSAGEVWEKTPWGMAAKAIGNVLSSGNNKPSSAKNYSKTRIVERGGGAGSGYKRKVKQGYDPKSKTWVDIGVVK